jgi:hypothetical protein
LEQGKIPNRFQFNMLTPKDHDKFFNELRKWRLAGFLSEIGVAMRKAAGEKD